MHPKRPYIMNELSGHASLLLSAAPTIISNNTNNTTHDELPDINFKKPQNEVFRKLDGKIQKILAAHSNFNKLYALNDFSRVGQKPFELPPPLPRPPPWVPKVSSDYSCRQWAEKTLDNLNRVANMRQNNLVTSNNNVMQQYKPPTPTIDSVISRLHQRRQQEQLRQNQQINPTSISTNLTPEERKRFQVKLINIFKQQIVAVTKKANVNFPQASERSRTAGQKSLLLKKSPQSLYNTIRHETSLLLNRKDPVRYSTVKVVVPPIDFEHACKKQPRRGNENIDQWCPPRRFLLNYRNLQLKLKKAKRLNQFPLRVNRNINPQPASKITVEQFAKCLNLVRPNDPSLRRHQEKQSDIKWRLPMSDRPLRLRRIYGEKARMPASASYRAARKAGLQ